MDYSSVGYSEMLGDPVNVGVTLDNQTVLKNREGVRFGSRTMSHQPNSMVDATFLSLYHHHYGKSKPKRHVSCTSSSSSGTLINVDPAIATFHRCRLKLPPSIIIRTLKRLSPPMRFL